MENPVLTFSLFLIFMLFFGITFLIFWLISNKNIDKRLERIKKQTMSEGIIRPSRSLPWAQNMIERLVKFSMPKGSWDASPMKLQFLRAGFRSETAVFLYYASKTVLAVSLFLIIFAYLYIAFPENDFLYTGLLSIVLSAGGYYLPNLYLSLKIKKRKQQIFETFPDALDLIRICVSSGLGLDAAISRVGRELSITSKGLSEEFHQLSLELRAGATRENALKNLANRTGVEDIHSLVSMLIQSERFGTSVAESLRVHAEGLRSKRKLQAQETAAKIPAKLSIPMILCIFPALFVVILGPSVLGIIRMLEPIISNR